MAELVANIYSKALFEFALEESKVESVTEEFNFLIETFKAYPELYELFKTPKLSVDERKKVISDIFSEKLSAEMMNFMSIVLDKQRTGDLYDVHKKFTELLDAHYGILPAIVHSANPLDDSEIDQLIEQLRKLTGKEIRLSTVVDPEVIGGLRIRVGDKVIDGSIRNKLDLMKEELKQIIV
jgi:F-type H+-transporting ATPase subunit delta